MESNIGEEKKQESFEIDKVSSPRKELQSILLNGPRNSKVAATTQDEEVDDDDDTAADMALVKEMLTRTLPSALSSSSIQSLEDSVRDIPSDISRLSDRRAVSFSGIDSPASSRADDEKTQGELISKIETLRLKLDQANIDLSAEKSMRKKKDRNLVKLAKELNKRGEEVAAKNGQVAKMVETCRTFEARAEEARKELDERNAAFEKATREFHDEITEAQQKLREARREHDQLVKELNKKHSEELDKLRHDMLALKLEGDRLRALLAKVEMNKSPDQADLIVQRTLKEAMETPKLPPMRVGRIVLIAFGIIVTVIAAGSFQAGLKTLDAWCAPALPGTFVVDNASFEAPWWAPEPFKAKAFKVCGGRARTRVTLNSGKVTITKLNGGEQPFLAKRVTSLEIHPTSIVMLDKKGGRQRLQAPWSL